MSTTAMSVANLDRKGGHPALDFANTVDSRFKDDPASYLRTLDDIVEWHVLAGLLPAGTAKQVQAAAKSDPQLAEFAYRYGIGLREVLYRIFSAVARGGSPDPGDLEALNTILATQRPHQQLGVDRDGVKWQWRFDPGNPQSIFGPVVEAAAELLTSDRLDRVKECPSDTCGWLFLDTSRNHSRHWCSMQTCGNPAKVRRFRKKKKAQAAGSRQ
jgi:predicted RNA-binding Zn ribbon-like protein